jgi:hypothetical protein
MTVSYGRLIAIAATLAVAGCASNGASTDHSQGGGTNLTSDHRVLHPLTPEQLAQGLSNAAHVPSRAVSSATAPTPGLRYPPGRLGAAGVIVRYRWWRVAMPAGAAYSWVAHHQAAFLSRESSGSSSGPAVTDNEQNADFTPPQVPLSVNSATLTMAVAPLTATTSAIGAYAVVVPQPPRPAVENVPLTVNTVSVVTQPTNGNPGSGMTGRRTLTGPEAQTLVRDFDELSVFPSGRVPCPLSPMSESATFRANGHVWVATTGLCVGANVTLDGHPLATLNTSQPFIRDLRAALSHEVRRPIMMQTPVH